MNLGYRVGQTAALIKMGLYGLNQDDVRQGANPNTSDPEQSPYPGEAAPNWYAPPATGANPSSSDPTDSTASYDPVARAQEEGAVDEIWDLTNSKAHGMGSNVTDMMPSPPSVQAEYGI